MSEKIDLLKTYSPDSRRKSECFLPIATGTHRDACFPYLLFVRTCVEFQHQVNRNSRTLAYLEVKSH